MDAVTIRTATLDDLEMLLQFEQGIIETERPYDPTLKEGTINYYDLGALIASPEAEVVVATAGEEVIGSGYALIKSAQAYLKHSSYAYLGFMFVKPKHRGKGVNQKIITALKQWALSKNITEVRLEVYAENTLAKKAYEKAGFTGHMLEMRMAIRDST